MTIHVGITGTRAGGNAKQIVPAKPYMARNFDIVHAVGGPCAAAWVVSFGTGRDNDQEADSLGLTGFDGYIPPDAVRHDSDLHPVKVVDA